MKVPETVSVDKIKQDESAEIELTKIVSETSVAIKSPIGSPLFNGKIHVTEDDESDAKNEVYE